MKREIDVGAWQVDKQGRRFRMIGNVKEFETQMIMSCGSVVPISQIDKVQKSCEVDQIHEAEPVLGYCPIKKNHVRCDSKCAFYDNGCMKSTQTQGKRCPLSNTICDKSCMLFDDECQILKKWRI